MHNPRDLFSPEEIEMDLKKKVSKIPPLLLGSFLALLIIMMVVPYYSIKLDPEPRNVPGNLELGIPFSPVNRSHSLDSKEDIYNFVDPSDVIVKQTASKIATTSCKNGHRVCFAKALFYFARDEIVYINDPYNQEYIEYPEDTLYSGAADCRGVDAQRSQQ